MIRRLGTTEGAHLEPLAALLPGAQTAAQMAASLAAALARRAAGSSRLILAQQCGSRKDEGDVAVSRLLIEAVPRRARSARACMHWATR